ncbi:MAG: CobW family GTP-binding protein [Geminicoccaceae bacterium]
MTIADTLPVTVIGGYLGAGKTTLVNHLLRHADGLKLAVLVNDFGDLSIDADLIEAEDDRILTITGGCLCCSFGNDLAGTLADLKGGPAALDHILIEASGVALPGAIAGSIGLLQGFRLDGIVVLGDAETLASRARDRFMGDTVLRQLDDADLILLNKADLASSQQLEATLGWLRHQVPKTRVVTTERGAAPLALVLGIYLDNPVGGQGTRHDASDRFVTFAFETTHPVDAERLAGGLADPDIGLLRAKGFVRDLDGTLRTIQIVGHRHEITAAPPNAKPGLVCIGLKTDVKKANLERHLEALLEHFAIN